MQKCLELTVGVREGFAHAQVIDSGWGEPALIARLRVNHRLLPNHLHLSLWWDKPFRLLRIAGIHWSLFVVQRTELNHRTSWDIPSNTDKVKQLTDFTTYSHGVALESWTTIFPWLQESRIAILHCQSGSKGQTHHDRHDWVFVPGHVHQYFFFLFIYAFLKSGQTFTRSSDTLWILRWLWNFPWEIPQIHQVTYKMRNNRIE